jgi:hypothetical protein
VSGLPQIFAAIHWSRFTARQCAANQSATSWSESRSATGNQGSINAPSRLARGDDSWGRPVAPFVARDGTLYLSDDKGGVIYWIRPEGRRP